MAETYVRHEHDDHVTEIKEGNLMTMIIWALLPLTLITMVRSRSPFVVFVMVAAVVAAVIAVFSQTLAITVVAAANVVAYCFGKKAR